MMNNTFNFKRFGWFLRKTLLERPVQLFGLVGLSIIISLITYAVLKEIIAFHQAQNASFIFGFVGGGIFLASFVFNYFSSNASGSSYLTLPASYFEKWMCGIIVTGIIFPCLFLAFFHIIDLTFISSFHNGLNPKSPSYTVMFNSASPFSLGGSVARKGYIMFLNFTGAMLIGSFYFNKTAFIKVALLVCILYIGGHFLNALIAEAVFNKVSLDRALLYYGVSIQDGKEFGKVLLPDYASAAVDICMLYIVPAILWLTALVRLREKEF